MAAQTKWQSAVGCRCPCAGQRLPSWAQLKRSTMHLRDQGQAAMPASVRTAKHNRAGVTCGCCGCDSGSIAGQARLPAAQKYALPGPPLGSLGTALVICKQHGPSHDPSLPRQPPTQQLQSSASPVTAMLGMAISLTLSRAASGAFKRQMLVTSRQPCLACTECQQACRSQDQVPAQEQGLRRGRCHDHAWPRRR